MSDGVCDFGSASSAEFEELLKELEETHRVSAGFFQQWRQTAWRVFEQFEGAERQRLLRLAVTALVRQAATEALARESREALEELTHNLDQQRTNLLALADHERTLQAHAIVLAAKGNSRGELLN